jgi:hypothetical protein
MSLAPVLLFTFKRLSVLKQTVEALKNNLLANESELYIFSDAAKYQKDQPSVSEVRSYLRTIGGFKEVHIYEAENNKGLAKSIIDGVSLIINKCNKVIVLEDDLITSNNFLSYMNQCLNHYKKNKNVFSISGYSFSIVNQNNDVYFTKRGSSWGWATWKDRWQKIDWEVKDYPEFKRDVKLQRSFNKMGSDLSSMLKKQMRGQIDSWAIRWCYHQFKVDLFTVYPGVSKVKNIGFTPDATHTFDFFNRYNTKLDESNKHDFNFVPPNVNNQVIKKFTSYYSLSTRIKYKILNSLYYSLQKIKKLKDRITKL